MPTARAIDDGIEAASEVPCWRPSTLIDAFDAEGRFTCYVFPWVHSMSQTEERAVDVYSAEGDRVFAGLIRDVDWDVALGEYVYAVDEDPVTAEERVVRYRLVLPGEEER